MNDDDHFEYIDLDLQSGIMIIIQVNGVSLILPLKLSIKLSHVRFFKGTS